MASLNNPITLQNQIDRFADYVVAAANSGIVWGTNAIPFPDFPGYVFGGDTSGKTISIQGAGYGGYKITADRIYTGILLETYRYSNIRYLRAILYVTSTDEQTGQYYQAPVPGAPGGVIFDDTQKAHLNTAYTLSADTNSLARGQIVAGNKMTSAGLEDFFDRARSLYYNFLGQTHTEIVTVCHSSCHYSCHNSRSRR
jgi:hypothetical protein